MADARSTTARRSFIARAAGAIAAWPVVRWRTRDALAHIATSPTATQPNDATLRALGDAVLPTELRPEGVARAAAEFRRWMDGYRPGAEANHGYGTGTIEKLPADPRPAWQQQLAALDADARRTSGGSFSTLSREQRQVAVRAALGGERGDALPNPLAARHVALALLAYFYDSPAATDLCYSAEIGRQQCRPLAAQKQQPVALRRGGR